MSYVKTPYEAYIVDSIKKRRKELKLKQEDLAKFLGVSVGYIGQIESKKLKSMYSHQQLNELAKYLKCSPKDFMPDEAM